MRLQSRRFALGLLALTSMPAALSAQGSQPGMQLIPAVAHAVSPPLRDVVPELPSPRQQVIPRPRTLIGSSSGISGSVNDAVLQSTALAATTSNSAIGLNFDGMGAGGGTPPDTNLSVGATQVVQIVNNEFTVFSKSTGSIIYGPAANHTIFTTLGAPCGTFDGTDPTVLYDKMAGRWLISDVNGQLSVGFLCVAVSQTSDATGAYNLYAFNFGSYGADYQKFGVWPDAYYLSTNAVSTDPTGVCAFPRNAMLAGQAITQGICFKIPITVAENLLPSDFDGSNPPPVGEPNFFLGFSRDASGFTDGLNMYRFHADFTNPNNSTFSGPFSVQNVAAFTPGCNAIETGFDACVPQPGTGEGLTSLGNFVMYRLSYRNFGSYESLVVNHSVQVNPSSSQVGVRWYEIRDPDGTPTVHQQGTYAPDSTTYRWMGSAAQDQAGDVAVGYSVSDSTSIYPGVRFAGRLSTDPLDVLEAETAIVSGTASQFGTPESDRWGDYSSMSIDPTDDCTFWYTAEYIAVSGGSPSWNTRIASFKFNNCGAPPPDFTISVVKASQPSLAGGEATYNVDLTASNGFNQPVTLSCGVMPAGATCSAPPPVTPSASGTNATITVNVPVALGPSTNPYSVTITGTSGGLSHSAQAQLFIATLSATITPSVATIQVGSSANFTISLTATDNFAGPVSLNCAGLASGLRCVYPAPIAVPGSATLAVFVDAKPSASLLVQPSRPLNPLRPLFGEWRITFAILLLALTTAIVAYWRKAVTITGWAQASSFLLVIALAISLISCSGGTTGSKSSGGTGNNGTGITSGGGGGASGSGGSGGAGSGGTGGSGGSGGTGGGTGGGSNPVTTQFILQGRSQGAAVNLNTLSITVP
jgi:hypothetical protein